MARIDQDSFSNVSWNSDQQATAQRQHQHQHQRHQHNQQQQQQRQQDWTGFARGADPGMAESSSNAVGRGDEVEAQDDGSFAEQLECAVSSPVKENDGSKDAFVSYLITTHSTFPSFQKPVFKARRRFTDFLFLYKALCKDFAACAVPPLPAKERLEYVRGDRFGPDFTTRRCHSFQRFLTRISLHPVLRRADILHTFLESPDWNATMKSRQAKDASLDVHASGGGGGGMLDNLTDAFINVFSKLRRADKRFVDVKERSDKLDQDLANIEKVVARVARREENLETDFRELTEQFQKLVQLEPGVEPSVHTFAVSVHDTAAGVMRLREATDLDYLGSLRDMQAYSLALRNLLKARDQKQLDFESLTDYLSKSQADRDTLQAGGSTSSLGSGVAGGAGSFLRSKLEDVRGVDQEQSRREKQRRLEMQVEKLSSEVENARKMSERFDEQVVREVHDFERIKRVEFKRQLCGLADAHVDFYGDVVDIWERYINEMEPESTEGA